MEIIAETYTAIFRKKDETMRKMSFIKLKDLPSDFLASKLSKDPKGRIHPAEGSEVVWDLEENNFRIFNWKTVIGEVVVEPKKIVL